MCACVYTCAESSFIIAMNATALNNLWIYLQSLNLTCSNRKWLAEHLVEPTPASTAEEDETEYLTSSPAMREILNEGLKPYDENDYEKIDLKDLWK